MRIPCQELHCYAQPTDVSNLRAHIKNVHKLDPQDLEWYRNRVDRRYKTDEQKRATKEAAKPRLAVKAKLARAISKLKKRYPEDMLLESDVDDVDEEDVELEWPNEDLKVAFELLVSGGDISRKDLALRCYSSHSIRNWEAIWTASSVKPKASRATLNEWRNWFQEQLDLGAFDGSSQPARIPRRRWATKIEWNAFIQEQYEREQTSYVQTQPNNDGFEE